MRTAAHLLLAAVCAAEAVAPGVPAAAPVPAPPARLDPAHVAGRWDVREGGWHGTMIFARDGVYSWRAGDSGSGAWGRWWVTDRGDLRLSECRGPDCTSEWAYVGFDLRGHPRELRARAYRLSEPAGLGMPVLMVREKETP